MVTPKELRVRIHNAIVASSGTGLIGDETYSVSTYFQMLRIASFSTWSNESVF